MRKNLSHFLALAAVTCLSAQSFVFADGLPFPKTSPKKGVGHTAWGKPRVIEELGCTWYYNWGAWPEKEDMGIDSEFVPMVWDGVAIDEKLAAVLKSGATTLITFNEPDNEGQANMTVEEALAIWPKLMASGLRLGSPAPTTANPWLDRFMSEALERQLRVDFICLHWYGDITAPDAVGELKRYLETYWDRYHLPIWLTEFSGADFSYHLRKTTVADNADFAREAALMMESLPFVERYAWFASQWAPNFPQYQTVGLVDPTTQQLTAVGVAYRDAGSE